MLRSATKHRFTGLSQRYSPTESSLLKLLASEQTVSKFDETAVIFANLNDQVASGVELTQSELVVVLVVQDVKES